MARRIRSTGARSARRTPNMGPAYPPGCGHARRDRSGDGVLDRSQALDLDAHDVAGPQELRRVERHADAVRRAGEDEGAGLERARLAGEGDEGVDREDEVARAG